MGTMVVDRYVLERVRLYAQNNPKRYAALSCTIGGLLFGVITAVAPFGRVEWWPRPWPAIVLQIVIVGALCGGCMAVFTFHLLRRMAPLPPDTDPARMRAAQRLVRKGVLGSDPATNALAAQLAEQVQSVPRWKKATTIALLGLTALEAFLMVQKINDGNVGEAVFYGAGALFFLLVLTVVQPRADRLYRNAAKLRQAVAHSNDARSGEETAHG
ncbi:hypothetical protein [Saccharopolyspora sp. NPDC002376]